MKVLILLAIVACATALVTRVKLNRMESRRSRLMRAGLWREHLKQKHLARLLHTRAVGKQNVNDYDDLEYVGNITLGSNHDMEFSIVLDTGSANLWIPDITCKTSDCNSKHKYDSSKSTTYKRDGRTWSVEYGDGSNARGFLGTDTMTFGGIGEQQVVITAQTFGQTTSMSGFEGDIVDGILGLGFTSLADDDVVTPLENAIAQGQLDQPLFTVWMEHRGFKEGIYGGQFTYGGLDPDHCGPEIESVPLTEAMYWEFKMNSIGANGQMNSQGWQVISDTGTSFIGGPSNVIESVANALGAEYDWYNELYKFQCNAVETLTIDIGIGSKIYNIKPVNYVVKLASNYCALSMFAFDFGGWGPSWILGDPFIRQYCQIQYVATQRIGFAASNQPAA